MRRLGRWLACGLVAGALVAVALAVASRTGALRALERRAVVYLLERATDTRVTLAEVGGTLGHSLVLGDLRLAVGGRTVVRVPRLEVVYAPLSLLRGVLRLERVTLAAPRVRAVREGGARPFALQPGGGLPVEVDHLEVVDGRVAVALLDTEPPRRFAATALALAARGHLGPGGAELEVAKLRFVPRGLALAPVEAAGRVTASPSGAVRVRGFHLASGRSRLGAEVELDGTRAIDAHLALAPLAAVALQGRLAPGTPPAYRLSARVTLPRPEALAAGVTGSATGRVHLDGRGFEAADRHARARVVLTHAMIRGVPLEHGVACALVEGARVQLTSAPGTGPELRANGTGGLDLARHVADLTPAAPADLARLGRRPRHPPPR